jgi:hypothetical protein
VIGVHSVSLFNQRIFLKVLTILDSGLASAEAGLDVVMPTSTFWGVAGEDLTMMVNNGSLPESRVTDMATRIVAAWYQMGQNVCLSPLYSASVNIPIVRLS